MTHEAIRAEYDKARAPDGTIPWERMKELARRLYGYELAEGPPLPAAEHTKLVEDLEALDQAAAEDPNEPDWEVVSDHPFAIRVVPR
jgi:hypothetical protein